VDLAIRHYKVCHYKVCYCDVPTVVAKFEIAKLVIKNLLTIVLGQIFLFKEQNTDFAED